MKYKYLYLVSYMCDNGYGDAYVKRRKKVKNFDDIDELKDIIKKGDERKKGNIILINVQLIN